MKRGYVAVRHGLLRRSVLRKGGYVAGRHGLLRHLNGGM